MYFYTASINYTDMLYCLQTSDWLTLWGACASSLAIIVALFVAFYQERKSKKRQTEKDKNLGETIFVLVHQLSTLIEEQLKIEYQKCISELKTNLIGIPRLKILPRVSIDKLNSLSPELIYHVFLHYNLSKEDYKKFILSIDRISSYMYNGLKNLKDAEARVIYLRNKYIENRSRLNTEIARCLRDSKRNSCYDFWASTICRLLQVKEFHDKENLAYYHKELVIPTKKHLKKDSEVKESFMLVNELIDIYSNIEEINKTFILLLEEGEKHIINDKNIIVQICSMFNVR